MHYFLEDRAAQRTRDEIDLMRLQADTNVQLAAFPLAGLSSDSVTVVNEADQVLREQQGLPKDPPDLMSSGSQDPTSGRSACARRRWPSGARLIAPGFGSLHVSGPAHAF